MNAKTEEVKLIANRKGLKEMAKKGCCRLESMQQEPPFKRLRQNKVCKAKKKDDSQLKPEKQS